MKKILPLLLLFALLLVPQHAVRADTGPKPTMTFTFQLPSQTWSIVSGTLYECGVPDCADARPLEEVEPQRFHCDASSCFSMAYGYADYFRLEITFSNGKTLQSNVFTKKAFDADYVVTLSGDTLAVEEKGGKTDGKKAGFSLPALLLTLFVELLLAYAYARKKDFSLKRFLAGVFFANVLTNPLFTFFLAVSGSSLAFALLIVEPLIVFVEGILLYLVMKKDLGFWRCLLLSLLFNLASILAGFFLPI